MVVKAGREITTTRRTKRLTYENMREDSQAYENADELLTVFDTVRGASLALASPYKYVCDWFKAQFPDYKKSLVFKDGKLTINSKKPPEITEYKQKISLAS